MSSAYPRMAVTGVLIVAHIGHELVLVLARDLKIFDGLGKLPRPRLDFLEESRVLDGDNGLIGEGIDKLEIGRAHV